MVWSDDRSGNSEHLNQQISDPDDDTDFAYVGCGAAELNRIANESGVGVPGTPSNKNTEVGDIENEMTPAGQEVLNDLENINLPNQVDLLGVTSTASAIEDVINHLMKTAKSRCWCCKKVTIRVDCFQDLADWEKRSRRAFSVLGENKCGKVNTYDCQTGVWSGWN
jgi:hypothetical protein